MRDDLHGFSKEISFSFLLNYGLVNFTGGNVIVLGGGGIQKSFIMPEVQVGFSAVFRYVAFAVFVGV